MLPACPLAGEGFDSDESVTYETGGRSYRVKIALGVKPDKLIRFDAENGSGFNPFYYAG